MTKTIYKYPLPAKRLVTIDMPEGADVLTVQLQGSDPQLWVLVDPDAPMEPREFRIYGTGDQISDGHLYVGTIQAPSGLLVLHVFEVILSKPDAKVSTP